MAKLKFNPIISKLTGANYQAIFDYMKDRPPDFCFSSNQYGIILMRKPKSTKRVVEVQEELRDRFKQLECMWKALTLHQLQEYKDYSRIINISEKRGIRPIDYFRREGLKWSLDNFLRLRCNPQHILILEKETEWHYGFRYFLLKRFVSEWDTGPQRGVRG